MTMLYNIIHFFIFLFMKCETKLESLENSFLAKASNLTDFGSMKCQTIPPEKQELTEDEKKCREKQNKSELREKQKKKYGGSFIF